MTWQQETREAIAVEVIDPSAIDALAQEIGVPVPTVRAWLLHVEEAPQWVHNYMVTRWNKDRSFDPPEEPIPYHPV